MNFKPIFLDSITDVTASHVGLVAISGSHGGLYPAAIASGAGLHAVVFNDAGIGLQNAGIGGVIALETVGMAGATVQAMSARIGSAQDMGDNGVISFANSIAQGLGVSIGMGVLQASLLLESAPAPIGKLPRPREAQSTHQVKNGEWIHLLDSASMVSKAHVGAIVITGSHGALIGGNPDRALKAAARIAVFNDAGFGPDKCGAERLPALDIKGIAAICVSAESARIGDAVSALETGVISALNTTAELQGAAIGIPLKHWLDHLPNPLDAHQHPEF